MSRVFRSDANVATPACFFSSYGAAEITLLKRASSWKTRPPCSGDIDIFTQKLNNDINAYLIYKNNQITNNFKALNNLSWHAFFHLID